MTLIIFNCAESILTVRFEDEDGDPLLVSTLCAVLSFSEGKNGEFSRDMSEIPRTRKFSTILDLCTFLTDEKIKFNLDIIDKLN